MEYRQQQAVRVLAGVVLEMGLVGEVGRGYVGPQVLEVVGGRKVATQNTVWCVYLSFAKRTVQDWRREASRMHRYATQRRING